MFKKIVLVLPFVFSLLLLTQSQKALARTNFNGPAQFAVMQMHYANTILTFDSVAFDIIKFQKVPPRPDVTVVNNCGSSTLSTTATGSLLWSTGETTSSITVKKTGVYTVKQTVNGVTSTPGLGVAAPKSIPAKPVITVTNNCGSSTLSTAASGTLFWNTGETTSSITVSIPVSYTLIQTVNGCSSKAASATAAPKVIPVTPAITVANNCGSSTLSIKSSGKLLWNTGETTPSINVKLGGTYTVTATINGCTSKPGSCIAAPKVKPQVPEVNVVNNCGSSTLSTTATGALLWSNGLITQAIEVPAAGTYTVKQTVNGCTSGAGSGKAAPLKKPTVTASTIVVSTNAASCSAKVDFDTTVNLKGTPAQNVKYRIGRQVITSPYIFPLGKTTVAFTATNLCGINTGKFVVRVIDTEGPSITCKPDDSVYIATKTYTVPGTQFDAKEATDNCETPSLIYRLSGATFARYSAQNTSLKGVKFHIGTTVISWKATDESGNISICQTKLTVVDPMQCSWCVPGETTPNVNRTELDLNSSNNELTDIKQIKPGVNVMPNPSSQYFTLTLNSKSLKKLTITVMDVTGRIIEQKFNVAAQSTIQLGSNYLPGIYIAEIKQGNDKTVLKLLKIKR